jgi:hypothetical protein
MANPVYRNNEFTPERCKITQYCLYEAAGKVIKTGTNIAFVKNMYVFILGEREWKELVIS